MEYKDLPKKRKDYMIQWDRDNIRRIMIKINKNAEKEMLEWIESQPNKQAYIKSLIESDMKKCQNSNKEKADETR